MGNEKIHDKHTSLTRHNNGSDIEALDAVELERRNGV